MTDKEKWIRIEDDKEVTDEMLEAQTVAKRMFRINFKVIEDKMNKKILEQLKNNDSKLKTLNLCNKKIEISQIFEIAKALQDNDSLKELDLSYNKIGDEGAEALAEALKINKGLNTLILEFNIIGDAGAKSLAEALKTNDTLKSIKLCTNHIGDEGAEALAEALKINKGLNEFYLNDVRISHCVKKKLFNVLEVNKNLDKFIINNCDIKKLVKDLYIKEKILIISNKRFVIDKIVDFGWHDGSDDMLSKEQSFFEVNSQQCCFPHSIFCHHFWDSRDLQMYFDFIVKELETIINQSKQLNSGEISFGKAIIDEKGCRLL